MYLLFIRVASIPVRMGCDWYRQTTIVGRGHVVEGVEEPEGTRYYFQKRLLERNGNTWSGTVEDIDGPIPDDTEWVYVVLDGEPLVKHEHYVPGPYEIEPEEDMVSITAIDDGLVVVSTTRSPRDYQ
eukprot:m.37352 g.37352  ORF g.37352 m.37352 type:complete len:127 (+) comp5521_c0_seq1:103-483(+)